MKRLEGKTAIITGGANGIGRVTAELFVRSGAAVALWDIDDAAGQEAVIQLTSMGGDARYYKVNTADGPSTIKAAARVATDFGRIDILINNAGVTRDASMKKMSSEQWQQVIDINLTGVFNCTKAVAPYLTDQGAGRIINASSVVAHNGNFGQTNYVASKAGVIGMTKVWAREYGRKGITVNAVAPGFVNTDMIHTVPQEIIDGLIAKTPMGRLAEAEDIAQAYLFLSSDDAAFITGTVLNVDGGLVI